jgi:hypothetical protein
MTCILSIFLIIQIMPILYSIKNVGKVMHILYFPLYKNNYILIDTKYIFGGDIFIGIFFL